MKEYTHMNPMSLWWNEMRKFETEWKGEIDIQTLSGYADGSSDSFLTKHLVLREKGYTFVLALLNR